MNRAEQGMGELFQVRIEGDSKVIYQLLEGSF